MILIDLEKCYECGDCTVQCSYPLHHGKTSFITLIETAIRKITCRHCEDAPCVISCPTKALAKQDEGLTRAGMLCTSCKTCLIACPFGVNTLETVNFEKAPCDLCEGREITCVKTCSKKAITEGNFKEDAEKNIYKVADGIYAKAIHWKTQLGIKNGGGNKP